MLGKTVDINIDCDQWEEIVEAVDKTDVPVQCLKRLTIKLENGRRRQISITKLRKQGMPEQAPRADQREVKVSYANTFTL